MKLVLAIINHDDANTVTQALTKKGFSSTKLATTGGFVLQNLGQKYLSANTASIFLSLESVFGALFSVWLLHERMTGRMVLGCGLMFAAVLLAEVKFEQVVVYCRKAQRS